MRKHPMWPPAEIAMLKRLVRQGLKVSEVATQLNEVFERGRTKNSVIGMAHRQGLHFGFQRPEPPYSFADLPPDACRWIEGDSKAERPFECSSVRLKDSSYCAKHAKRAVGAMPQRRLA